MLIMFCWKSAIYTISSYNNCQEVLKYNYHHKELFLIDMVDLKYTLENLL